MDGAILICLPKFLRGHKKKLEKVFVKHYVPNQMPDPKREWSLLENINGNNSELISQSTYHLQSSDNDANPEVQYFSKFQMMKFSKGHNS